MKKLLACLILILSVGCVQQVTNNNNNNVPKPDEETPVAEVPAEVIDLNKIEMDFIALAGSNEVQFVLGLTNKNEAEAELYFSTGQKYEIVVTKGGNEVYRYTNDRMFTEALEQLTLPSRERLEWEESWNYTIDGERLPEGEYEARAFFVPYQISNMEVNDQLFSMTTNFVVPAENKAYRNVTVEGENGRYIVRGEGRVFEATASYFVEDGQNYLVEETFFTLKEGAPSWSEFELEINIDQDKLPEHGTVTLVLFERSAKDGSIVNEYYVTLERL
ncbi:BsuPI-related putative proteinase inhibitor [Bacillus sp. FJAT-45066]|uniref:BsuPI-related putative proteinase inhibitor n=1 Tax=Bacillus sp. FJAT-45066 TaxID=2011010 RepID=UPI000BB99721|nr:BsuPI-related putative proteinase inhibitor [Bacillus sp. FJAT-45066]